ncbi:MAG: NAD kinase [Xanthomonadales bacterium]|nr:NAD kinase [Xanthomonadales bacterium]MCC6593282.1 NAD kinase [Xanthomonadales bacterium]MCE7930909.1 NAD kinase [Xanthomonadales bacterium PRO6]
MTDLPPNAPPRIAFVASRAEPAQLALAALTRRYPAVPVSEADLIVSLGGDGFMLHTLHRFASERRIPVFGMKLGTVGFLMNLYREEGLLARLAAAQKAVLHPLRMRVVGESGGLHSALAINEVSLLRQTKQAAKLRITVDGVVRVEELICDGALLATAAGSTAYNLSAYGPILPLGSDVLALTPISPFRPRRWRGAIVRRSAVVKFEVLDHYKRPVSATADATEVRDVVEVEVAESPNDAVTVLFDPEHSLEERILAEQFTM